MDELTLIASGAEAHLYRGRFLGYEVVIKYRTPKVYRDPRFDASVRRERTLSEARAMMTAMESGVTVPTVLYVDPENALIIMEYVNGLLLRDALPSTNEELRRNYLELLGVYVGRLHRNDLTHGDLTTSNVMISNDGVIYLIDFGLSKISNDVEDKAVDIHLLIRSFESTHYSLTKELVRYFLRGYSSVIGSDGVEAIMDKVKEIRLRGRYIEERRLRDR
ncbi:MAG: Kae1-associated kinase Bud32 [Sulfolobales archaeon]